MKAQDNREVKIVFLGGEYGHIMSCAVSSVQKSLPGIDQDVLIGFAKDVMRRIATHHEYIVDGLVRVDVFKNNDGELVVNELESLEARYFTHGNKLQECQLFLEQYWERKILICIRDFA